MSALLADLIANNRAWAAGKTRRDPGFFRRLVAQQRPDYLWIGCSDSRVPANEIVDLDPGELFVHRNVANLAPEDDPNYLSTLQFAVDVLGVSHVLVVGHYGCGGVGAARRGLSFGAPVDDWLAPLRALAERRRDELDALPDDDARDHRLVELNVCAQVEAVAQTRFVRGAWTAGRSLHVHGWCYSLATGLVNDLEVTRSGPGEATP